MAQIKKRGNSYTIIVSLGYDLSGKQITKSKTWKPASNMTPKQIEKAVAKEAAKFEEACQQGLVLNGNIKFGEFIDQWLEKYAKPELKGKTYSTYQVLLARIRPALGHIKLNRLQPHHLLDFYENLREGGIKASNRCSCKIDFKAYLKERGLTKVKLAEAAGVSVAVLDSITRGKNISTESAKKVCAALQEKEEKLFECADAGAELSEKTVLHHHRLLSSILQTAVQWQMITDNPCRRIKAPKVRKKEAQYMDEEAAIYLLERLESVETAYKAMIYVLLYSGMRRGELCGLEWQDIDFEHDMIHIKRNSVYVSGEGITTTTPKTESSVRVEKIPHLVMEILKEHKHKQNIQRISVGADWVESNRLFTQWDGKPIFPDSVSKWFKRFLKEIGLEGYSLHSLRHTNASIMIASGMDVRTVAARLGHAQTSTTTNIYAHLIKSADERAASAIDDVLSRKRG